jgi:hypothetical protein
MLQLYPIIVSEPIFSLDGKFMWTGSEWIPAPTSSESVEAQDPLIELSRQIDTSVSSQDSRLISDNTIDETHWTGLETQYRENLGIDTASPENAKFKCVNCGWWGDKPKRSLWWGLCCPNCPSGPFAKENKIIPIEYSPQEYANVELRQRILAFIGKIFLLGVLFALGISNRFLFF